MTTLESIVVSIYDAHLVGSKFLGTRIGLTVTLFTLPELLWGDPNLGWEGIFPIGNFHLTL